MENAQNSSYVSHATQHLISYLKNELSSSPRVDALYETPGVYSAEYQAYLANWDAKVNAGNNTLASNPLPIERNENTVALSTYDPIPQVASSRGSNIHQSSAVSSAYLLRSVSFLNGVAVTDHAVEARIWKSPFITSNRLESTYATDAEPWNQVSNYWSDEYDKRVHVNIEFSWPVSLPYSDRTRKSYAFLDLVK